MSKVENFILYYSHSVLQSNGNVDIWRTLYTLSPITPLYPNVKVLHSISTNKPKIVTVGPHTLPRMFTFPFNSTLVFLSL